MEKEVLTVGEAAEFLRISIYTFRKLLREGKIPGKKVGREWRFTRQSLLKWLEGEHSQEEGR